jgi:hypothetical protein
LVNRDVLGENWGWIVRSGVAGTFRIVLGFLVIVPSGIGITGYATVLCHGSDRKVFEREKKKTILS